jgi:hypothetical protein
MKVGVVLIRPPPKQEGQGMWGHEGEDCVVDIGKAPS